VSAHPVTDFAALDSSGNGIRVRFRWKDDRYSHHIELVDGLLTQTLLESVEGDEFTAWPPSPPFQQANGLENRERLTTRPRGNAHRRRR